MSFNHQESEGYGETPEKLRELERGWREKRRVLGEKTMNTAGSSESALIPAPSGNAVGKALLRRNERDGKDSGRKQVAVGIGLTFHPAQLDRCGQPDQAVTPRDSTDALSNKGNKGILACRQRYPVKHALPVVGGKKCDARGTALPTPPASPRPPPLVFSNTKAPPAHFPEARRVPQPYSSRPFHVIQLKPEVEPKPILPGLLPPTPRPVPLTSHSKSTIQVLAPTSGRGMIIRTSMALINIASQGRSISIASPDQGKKRVRRLSLDDSAQWTAQEKKEWETIWELVMGFKRATPRVSPSATSYLYGKKGLGLMSR